MNSPLTPQPLRVLVLGATGFVGSHACRELLRRGHVVTALVRAGSALPADLSLLPTMTGTPEDAAFARSLAGMDAIVNSVGIIREAGGSQTFEHVHIDLLKSIVRSADEVGLKRLVHVSAIGAAADGPSAYSRSKAAGEAIVRGAKTPWTILRPSIIHGPDGEFMRLLKRFVEPRWWDGPLLVGMPYFGDGSCKLQPVHVNDVAAAIAAALENKAAERQTVELGGPDRLSWKELYRTAATVLAGRPRRLIGVPAWKGKLLAATVMKTPLVPEALKFDAGMVAMSQHDNVADLANMQTILGITPRPFEPSLREYASQVARA